MKLYGDYHTHSKYSKFNHGKNTIAEMVERATEVGLKEIAITDHGARHLFYGVRRGEMAKIRKEIDELNEKNKDVKVLFGIEANLIGVDGDIDVNEQENEMLDICLVGFHKGAWARPKNFFKYTVPNNLRGKEYRKQLNTTAYVNAVEKHKIDVLTHLKCYVDIDIKKVAEACARTGTLIELNNRHFKFTREDIEVMLNAGVNFIVNSDAHKVADVGKIDNVLHAIKDYNIPLNRIVNLDKKPEFVRRQLKKS